LQALLGLAFANAPAMNANAEIAKVRTAEGDARSYEVVIPKDRPKDAYLFEVLLPRLVYFLECHGAKLPACEGVFLTFFEGEMVHFVRAREAVELLGQRAGMSAEALVQRYGQG
jgi:hypothetical protein